VVKIASFNVFVCLFSHLLKEENPFFSQLLIQTFLMFVLALMYLIAAWELGK